MDIIWSPWRYEYIKAGGSETDQHSSCVFCAVLSDPRTDAEKFILHRARHNFIILNLYPYISGHLMIVPYAHTADLDGVPKEATDELMDLTKRCQTVLREVYRPHGFNMGVNQGRAAGAGVADHVHLHIMPRWTGDTNFMSTVSETRVIPEDLTTTYDKLRGHFK